jgi:hypothetical protein
MPRGTVRHIQAVAFGTHSIGNIDTRRMTLMSIFKSSLTVQLQLRTLHRSLFLSDLRHLRL